MSHPSRLPHIHDLVEADFRKIQSLLVVKHEKTYTIDYIRKVCKDKRKNALIHRTALHYLTAVHALKQKV